MTSVSAEIQITLRWTVALVAVGIVAALLSGCGPSGTSPQEACEIEFPIEVSRAEAEAFESRVNQILYTDTTGPFRLEATSTEVTSFIYFTTKGTPLEQPYVRFLPDRLCMGGDLLALNPLRVHFSVLATARLSDRRVQVTLERVLVDGRSLPGPALGYLSRIINETIQDAQLHVTLTELRLDDDRLILAGTR